MNAYSYCFTSMNYKYVTTKQHYYRGKKPKSKRKTRKKLSEKRRSVLLFRKRKMKQLCKERKKAQCEKHLSIEDTTYDEDDIYDSSDEGWVPVRTFYDEHCPRINQKHWYLVEVKDISLMPSRDFFICSCRLNVQRARDNVERIRTLLMCIERLNSGFLYVLSNIFGKHLTSFLSEAEVIEQYLELEKENERKRLMFKVKEHASGIKMCISHWERKLWSQNAYEYKIKRWKRKFSLYDWKYFRLEMDKLFGQV